MKVADVYGDRRIEVGVGPTRTATIFMMIMMMVILDILWIEKFGRSDDDDGNGNKKKKKKRRRL